MTATPSQARDEVFDLFTTKWTASDILDPMPEIRYQGRELPGIPDGPYIRLSMQQVTSPQSAHTMRDDPGQSGTQFTTHGLIFGQLFMPMKGADAYYYGDLLAAFARDIFRATETPSGVWFRNARFNELDPDGSKYRWNVKVEYEYNELTGEGN